MINKNNHYLKIKVSDKTFDFLSQFSDDFEVSISNFGEYCIDSVISDLGFRTKDLKDEPLFNFFKTFAQQINLLYRNGMRSK